MCTCARVHTRFRIILSQLKIVQAKYIMRDTTEYIGIRINFREVYWFFSFQNFSWKLIFVLKKILEFCPAFSIYFYTKERFFKLYLALVRSCTLLNNWTIINFQDINNLDIRENENIMVINQSERERHITNCRLHRGYIPCKILQKIYLIKHEIYNTWHCFLAPHEIFTWEDTRSFKLRAHCYKLLS